MALKISQLTPVSSLVGTEPVELGIPGDKSATVAQIAALGGGIAESDILSDFLVSGLLSPTSATLSSTMSAGTAYVTGLRTVAPATAYTYAASSDTYDDLNTSGVVTHVAVANGATAPAVTANSLRLQKVVTSATAVTAVTQLASTQLALKQTLSGYQASLGYTPVQQGTGIGQLGNTIKIGWSGTKPKLTVDIVDEGNIALESWVVANYAALTGATFTGPINATSIGIGIVPSAPLDVPVTGGRLLVRSIGTTLTLDSVNPANSAFLPINFTATQYNFTGGGLVLPAGNSGAGGESLKVTLGSLLTTPESGAVEYNGTWYLTDSTPTRRKVESTNAAVLPSAITVTASPFVYQNTSGYRGDVLTTGGTVSLIEFSRDGTTWFSTGGVVGWNSLSPLDRVRVTYSVAPTMTFVPR